MKNKQANNKNRKTDDKNNQNHAPINCPHREL